MKLNQQWHGISETTAQTYRSISTRLALPKKTQRERFSLSTKIYKVQGTVMSNNAVNYNPHTSSKQTLFEIAPFQSRVYVTLESETGFFAQVNLYLCALRVLPEEGDAELSQ